MKPETTASTARHKSVVVTYAQDARPCGAKRYTVNADGRVEKQALGTSQGKMLVCEVTLDGPASITEPNLYAICSVPKGKSVDPKALFDYGVAGSGAALTRSAEHFEFRAGVPGMLVCDLDPKSAHECFPSLEYKDPAAYHAALVSVCPEMDDADAVSHPSGSHGDLIEIATGKLVKRSLGTHSRVAVKDQADIPRALKAIHERAMLAGHLHAFIDNAGIVHPRSIVDAQLGAIARPVYSCPAIVPQGYELRNRPAPVHHYGVYLDTKAALPDLTDAERKKYKAVIGAAEKRPEVKALVKKRRDDFLKLNPQWSSSINTVGSSKHGHATFALTGEENIDVTGKGVMTAREIADANAELVGTTCRDPLEPGYGGDSIAVIYDGIVFSWAHGGRVFRLPGAKPADTAKDYDPTIAAALWAKMEKALDDDDEGAAYGATAAALSYQYAMVRTGPGVAILDRKELHERPHGAGLMKKEAFFDVHASLKFDLPGLKPVNMARWWFGSTYRHTYAEMTLAPEGRRPKGKPQRPNSFNLWRGFACRPNEQGSCEGFKEYLLNVVCRGDRAGFAWVWRWMAQLVQRPWEKSGVVVVLVGPQGAGKSFFGEAVMSMFHERHGMQTANLDDLTGQFTAHSAGKLVILMDESFFVGDRRVIGQLKNTITATTERLEHKGVDAITIDSYARFIITSNEDHVVNAELSDRRHSVFKVSDAHCQDRPYFAGLHTELEKGGRARLLWELMQTDIGDGYITPYDNAARAEQQIHSLEPVAAWFLDNLRHGTLFWNDRGDPVPVGRDSALEAAQKSSRQIAGYVNASAFGLRLRKVISVNDVRIQMLGIRTRAYAAPPLAEARADFCRLTGLAIDWRTGSVARVASFPWDGQ